MKKLRDGVYKGNLHTFYQRKYNISILILI